MAEHSTASSLHLEGLRAGDRFPFKDSDSWTRVKAQLDLGTFHIITNDIVARCGVFGRRR